MSETIKTYTKDKIDDLLSGKADSDEIPTVSNGKLTITQGGVTKATFTANQSANTVCALDSPSGVEVATYDTLGGIQPLRSHGQGVYYEDDTREDVIDTQLTILAASEVEGRYYQVEVDSSNGVPFVNVPWEKGSTVSVTQSATSGATVGTVTVDGTTKTLYAPNRYLYLHKVLISSSYVPSSGSPQSGAIYLSVLTQSSTALTESTLASGVHKAGTYYICDAISGEWNGRAVTRLWISGTTLRVYYSSGTSEAYSSFTLGGTVSGDYNATVSDSVTTFTV